MSTEVLHPQANTATPVNGQNNGREYTAVPAVSVYEEPSHWQVQVDMPGVPKENAQINTEDNYLTITGRRNRVESTGRKLYREIRAVDYRRTFELPSTVDVSRISARMENGVLTVTLPKVEKVLPRTIEVTD